VSIGLPNTHCLERGKNKPSADEFSNYGRSYKLSCFLRGALHVPKLSTSKSSTAASYPPSAGPRTATQGQLHKLFYFGGVEGGDVTIVPQFTVFLASCEALFL
jgi:hypothetical protein